MKFRHKSFTLSEVFVAMIVIAIVGSVCIAFLKNRNDYTREYMYYSTYNNLVKVMDTVMDGPYDNTDGAITETNPIYIYLTTCNGIKCMKLKSSANLCDIFKDKLNFASYTGDSGEANCYGKLANGIQFIPGIGGYYYTSLTSTNAYTSKFGMGDDKDAYMLVVDIDGTENGKNLPFYDQMPFYITRTGKVIPEWGAITGFRGYAANEYDGAANATLMSFDVVYNNGNSNKLAILNGGRSVSFPVAACLAGYISGGYCNVGNNGSKIGKSSTCDASADCRVRLVKKMKWSR